MVPFLLFWQFAFGFAHVDDNLPLAQDLDLPFAAAALACSLVPVLPA